MNINNNQRVLTVLSAVLLMLGCIGAWGGIQTDTRFVSLESGTLSPLFALDTRNKDWILTDMFILDTRDLVDGIDSPLFTLDTRGGNYTCSDLFELDTRHLEFFKDTELFTLDTRGYDYELSNLFELDTRGTEPTPTPTPQPTSTPTIQPTATPTPTSTPEPYVAPRITNIEAKSVSAVELNWEYATTNVDAFIISRHTRGSTWYSAGSATGHSRSYLDATVVAGQYYEYRVAGVVGAMTTAYSSACNIQVPNIPNAPSEFSATIITSRVVSLSWCDSSADEDGFEVWKQPDISGDWNRLAVLESNVTTYTDSDTDAVDYYSYKARAFSRWGMSRFSNEDSVSLTSGVSHCGFNIEINTIDLTIDDQRVLESDVINAAAGALLEGEFQCSQSSPKGNAHPQRVVLGYRDAQGKAIGQPVELMELYGVPGCPGRTLFAQIPEDFYAPDNLGTNTLWIEMIMAHKDPIAAFMRETHRNESPMRKRLLQIVISPRDSLVAEVRIGDVQTTPESIVRVPVMLSSAGGEYILGFSIELGDGLRCQGISAGTDAQQAWIQYATNVPGRVGVGMMMPLTATLEAGNKQILLVDVEASERGVYPVRFATNPVDQMLAGGSASAGWNNGSVTVKTREFAGDVYPRPLGDGYVNEMDARFIMQFALNLIEPDTSEFARADCAPFPCGDGVVNLMDVMMVMQCASGMRPIEEACASGTETAQNILNQRGESGARIMQLASTNVHCNEKFRLPIVMGAQGDENAVSFSFSYNAERLSFLDVQAEGEMAAAGITPNIEHAADGQIGVALVLPSNTTLSCATTTILSVGFEVLDEYNAQTVSVYFVNSPVECLIVDNNSESLPTSYQGGTIIIGEVNPSGLPQAPTDLLAQAVATNQINLTWKLDASDADGVQLYRKTAEDMNWNIVAVLSTSRQEFADSAPSKTECSYRVASYNENGENFSGTVTTQTLSAAAIWLSSIFGSYYDTGNAAANADPDHDLIPNLLEYQLGSDPLKANNETLINPKIERLFGSDQFLTISYVLENGAPGNLSLQTKTNLTNNEAWCTNTIVPYAEWHDKRSGKRIIKLRSRNSMRQHNQIFLRMETKE